MSLENIIFGADGILYIQHHEGAPLISAKNIFRFASKSHPNKDLGKDYSFWSKYLAQPVFMENGITMRKFIECLMPWEQFFSFQTRVNLREYFNEMDKEVDPTSANYNCVDYYILYRNASVSPMRFEDVDFKTSLKVANPTLPDNPDYKKYELYSGYHLSGFIFGNDLPHDTSYVPMQYLADKPIYLDNTPRIQFGDWNFKENSFVKERFYVNENAYGAKYSKEGALFFEGYEDQITLEEFLRSFFRYIFRDIQKRDKGFEIKQEIEEDQETATILAFPSNKPHQHKDETVKGIAQGSDNVIEVPFKKISRQKNWETTLENFLVSRLIEDREIQDAITEYEIRNNIHNRIAQKGFFEKSQIPENRAGSIGFIAED